MSNNGQKIERKMSQLRQELTHDGQQLAASTERLKDWREYVRAYPWLSVAGATALGFFVAPSRSKPSRTIEQSNEEVATAAAGGTLLGLVGATVGRAAATMASKFVMDRIASHYDLDQKPLNDSPWPMEKPE